MLAIGPLGLMAGGPEDHFTDSRELYVLVEGDERAHVDALDPDAGYWARRFAQLVSWRSPEDVSGVVARDPVRARTVVAAQRPVGDVVELGIGRPPTLPRSCMAAAMTAADYRFVNVAAGRAR